MTRRARPWIKICGITSVADAELAIAAGADALGLNFVPSSKRYIDETSARAIVSSVGARVECVGVVADLSVEAAAALRERVGFGWLQLHGHEPPEMVMQLGNSYQAIGVDSATDVERASAIGGERVLVDTKSPGTLGGSGRVFDWSLVRELCRQRHVILAGGLTPENIADATRAVAPWGVDVASGVEVAGDARRKDATKLKSFIAAARTAIR